MQTSVYRGLLALAFFSQRKEFFEFSLGNAQKPVDPAILVAVDMHLPLR